MKNKRKIIVFLISYILGIITNLTDAKVKRLYFYIKPVNLNKYFGQELSIEEQNIKRAELIKQITKD